MKIFYLKGYKWLQSQNQQVGIDFLGYGWYEALAKHIKPFSKKIKVKEHQCPDYDIIKSIGNMIRRKVRSIENEKDIP